MNVIIVGEKMKKEHSKKVYIGICIVFVVALVTLATSISFAYYKANVKEENKTQTTVKTGTFDIETSLSTTSAIHANDMNLINPEEIETQAKSIRFTAKSKSNTSNPGKFNIYLKDIAISNNLIHNDFKWQLLMDNEVIASGDFADLIVNGKSSTTKTNTDSVKYFDTYYLKTATNFNGFNQSNLEVRVYLLNSSENQNSLMNGTFSGKVAIEAYK